MGSVQTDGSDPGSSQEDEQAPQEQATDVSAPENIAPREGFLGRLEQRRGLSALVALATFAALVVGVLAAVPEWRDMLAGDDHPAGQAQAGSALVAPSRSSPAGSGLNAIDLVVRDPELRGDPNDTDAEFTPPAVEITVHNRGAGRSVITRVVVTVEDSAVISQCDSQGETVPVSATYDVTLPLRPDTGTVLRVPVSQQQGSDEADRFALRLGTPEREKPTTIHLYRLRFELETDAAEKRLPAGTAVVAIPMSPKEGGGYFWSVIYDSGKVVLRPGMDRGIPCMKENSAILKRLLSDDAELSLNLAAAKAVLRL